MNDPTDLESQVAAVNGAPAILPGSKDGPFGLITGDAAGGKVQRIYIRLNEKKLSALDRTDPWLASALGSSRMVIRSLDLLTQTSRRLDNRRHGGSRSASDRRLRADR